MAHDHPLELGAHGQGGLDRPARGLLDLPHDGRITGVAHGHDEVGAVHVDGQGQVAVGQLGRDHAVDLDRHDGLGQVDEPLADLVGQAGHQVLLPDHALGHEDGREWPLLGCLPLECGLERLS